MGKFSFLREARILNTNCVTSQNTSFLPMKDVFAPIDTGQSINGYNLTQKICETRMSVVFKAERKGDAVAIKFIKKRPEYAKQIEREISLLKDIDCPYIMHALDFFEYKDYTCFVMPLADQGSMHHNQKYPEDVVKRAIVSALKALRYLHENHIWHRDVKPDNLLMNKESIYLCDLGLAFRSSEPHNTTEYVGTLRFAAPEILTHKSYDESVDIWSLGVTAYTLLSGQHPFPIQPETCLRRAILKAAFWFPSKRWSDVSKEAKDVIAKMIVANPEERISIDEALNSPWLMDVDGESSIGSGKDLDTRGVGAVESAL